MGALGVGLVFVGYVLCYAAVADHGRFATVPWNGVTQDAYDSASGGDDSPATPGTPGKKKPTSPLSPERRRGFGLGPDYQP